MLEDLYEFEKCYFINYFQTTPSYSEGECGADKRRPGLAEKGGLVPEIQAEYSKEMERL